MTKLRRTRHAPPRGGRNQVVADTLQVKGDEEVEEWVLRAIQTGLMEAKMDQMQRVVVIRRCTNRVFGPSQWKVLVPFAYRVLVCTCAPSTNYSAAQELL